MYSNPINQSQEKIENFIDVRRLKKMYSSIQLPCFKILALHFMSQFGGVLSSQLISKQSIFKTCHSSGIHLSSSRTFSVRLPGFQALNHAD